MLPLPLSYSSISYLSSVFNSSPHFHVAPLQIWSDFQMCVCTARNMILFLLKLNEDKITPLLPPLSLPKCKIEYSPCVRSSSTKTCREVRRAFLREWIEKGNVSGRVWRKVPTQIVTNPCSPQMPPDPLGYSVTLCPLAERVWVSCFPVRAMWSMQGAVLPAKSYIQRSLPWASGSWLQPNKILHVWN